MGFVRYTSDYRPATLSEQTLFNMEIVLLDLESIQRLYKPTYASTEPIIHVSMYRPHYTMMLSHMKIYNPTYFTQNIVKKSYHLILKDLLDYENYHSNNYFFNRYVLTRPRDPPSSPIPEIRLRPPIIPGYRDDLSLFDSDVE